MSLLSFRNVRFPFYLTQFKLGVEKIRKEDWRSVQSDSPTDLKVIEWVGEPECTALMYHSLARLAHM